MLEGETKDFGGFKAILSLNILSFQLGKIDWLVDLQSFMFKHKIVSKPQKSLIASSILYVHILLRKKWVTFLDIVR